MDYAGPASSKKMQDKTRCPAGRRKTKPRSASKRRIAKCVPRKRSRRSCLKKKVIICKQGPVMNNAYLNFIREYRLKHCGLSPKELVQKAARAWCRMSDEKKERYRQQVNPCGEEQKNICIIL